jgi:hypothetical protein
LITVAGCTTASTLSQLAQHRRSSTQKPRSAFDSRGRFTDRRSTPIC